MIAALRSVSFLLQLVESVERVGEVLQVTGLLESVVALRDAPVADLVLLDAPIGSCLLDEALACGLPHDNGERIVLHHIFVRVVAIVEVLIARLLGQVLPRLSRELLLLLDHLGEQTQILQEVVFFLVLRVDLEDANDSVITSVNQVVKLRSILQRDHPIDDVLLEDLVRVPANLVKALGCLVDLIGGNLAIDLRVVQIVRRLIIVCLLQVCIHAAIEQLSRIVTHLVLLLLVLDVQWGGFVHLATAVFVLFMHSRLVVRWLVAAVVHDVEFDEAAWLLSGLVMLRFGSRLVL